LEKDTIVISARGTVGKFCMLPYPMAFNQTCYGLIAKQDIIDPHYLYYNLFCLSEQINSLSYGTTFNTITKKTFHDIKFRLPPLPEQQKIASILSAFDDKIELNNEMNKTLEEMAQAIFKHWFIDFEFPNENGEPYKSSGGEFVNSELGPIPKGWKVGVLSELCDVNMGQSPPSSTYNLDKKGIPFYQGVKDFGTKYPSVTMYCLAPKKIADEGDILLSVRAPVGEINVAIEKCCIGRGLAALRMKKGANNYLYYLMLNQKNNWTIFESGSVFTAINKAAIENLPIFIPPVNIIKKFNTLIQPVDERILNNTKENLFLSQLRDTLLPKLISGEIRVV
ncbi:MAG: type restriction enzyme subunit, partial [Thermoanaerobacterium sp.]|nr:type restriction enzyme subunit [Thermoanaerobacterium sp.]